MTRKPRGRPRLKEEDRKSEPVGIRLTRDLRDQLEDARRPDGRSLTEEIELRLSESFQMEKNVNELFGGRETRLILQIFGERIAGIEISTQSGWLNDRYTFDQVKSMIEIVLARLRPGGRRTIPKSMRWHPTLKKDAENVGRQSALLALACLESPSKQPPQLEPYYYKLAPLLRHRLQGASKELAEARQQTGREIWKYHGKRLPADAASDEAQAREVDAMVARSIAANTATANALVNYLLPKLAKDEKIKANDLANIFDGISFAKSLGNKKSLIIKRLKALIKGKLTEEPGSDFDRDVGKILDAAQSAAQKGEQK